MLEDLFDIWKIFNKDSDKPRGGFADVRALDDTTAVLDLPRRRPKSLFDFQVVEDLHLLPEEIPDKRLQIIVSMFHIN